MDQTYQPPPVRFRTVIGMSFPDADPWDPTNYGSLIEASSLNGTSLAIRLGFDDPSSGTGNGIYLVTW